LSHCRFAAEVKLMTFFARLHRLSLKPLVYEEDENDYWGLAGTSRLKYIVDHLILAPSILLHWSLARNTTSKIRGQCYNTNIAVNYRHFGLRCHGNFLTLNLPQNGSKLLILGSKLLRYFNLIKSRVKITLVISRGIFITFAPGVKVLILMSGNTKGGSITVLLTSCLTGLE